MSNVWKCPCWFQPTPCHMSPWLEVHREEGTGKRDMGTLSKAFSLPGPQPSRNSAGLPGWRNLVLFSWSPCPTRLQCSPHVGTRGSTRAAFRHKVLPMPVHTGCVSLAVTGSLCRVVLLLVPPV